MKTTQEQRNFNKTHTATNALSICNANVKQLKKHEYDFIAAMNRRAIHVTNARLGQRISETQCAYLKKIAKNLQDKSL